MTRGTSAQTKTETGTHIRCTVTLCAAWQVHMSHLGQAWAALCCHLQRQDVVGAAVVVDVDRVTHSCSLEPVDRREEKGTQGRQSADGVMLYLPHGMVHDVDGSHKHNAQPHARAQTPGACSRAAKKEGRQVIGTPTSMSLRPR